MNLGFISKLMRSLFERPIRTNKTLYKQLKYTLNLTLNLWCNLDVNVDLSMLRLSRSPGVLPDYRPCFVMIK